MKMNCLLSVGVIALLSGCSGSSGAAGSLNSLGALPSMSSLVNTSGSTTGLGYFAVNEAAVPVMTEIDADQHFWNGLLASLDSDDQAFFEVGMGTCRMADTVIRSFSEILRQTSVCYIRGMAELDNPPIEPLPSEPFGQENTDKLYRVDVTGMDEGEMNVFITVKGRDTAPDSYSLTLYFCEAGEDSVNEYETVEVNRSTGAFTSTSQGEHGDGKNARSVTATLIDNGDGTFGFDPESLKQAIVSWQGDGANAGNNFKGKIEIEGDEIRAWSYFSGSYNDGMTQKSFTDKNYAVARISGSSISELKFLEGGFVGLSDGEDWDYSYSGAVEFSSYYSSVSSGTYYDTVQSFDLGADEFLASGPSVTVDTSAYDCDATPDYVVTMDFTSPEVAALEASCEGDRFEGEYLCDASEIRDAQNAVYSGP